MTKPPTDLSVNLRLGVDLRPRVDARTADHESTARTIRRDLATYYDLVDRALRGLRFERAELDLIADACNGIGLSVESGSWSPGYLLVEVEDAIALNGLDGKWSVDAKLVLGKLKGCSLLELAALTDLVVRVWAHPERDTEEVYREAGALRDQQSAKTGRGKGK